MTESKAIRKLNTILRVELGTTAAHTARFQWGKTEDCPIYADNGHKEVTTPGGIIVGMEKTFIRYSYADLLGSRWALLVWTPPCMPECQWRQHFGNDAPYPRGQWHPIENVMLDPGLEPTLDLTTKVVAALKQQLIETPDSRRKRFELGQALKRKEQSELTRKWMDEEAQLDPAFDNDTPGKRGGSVSFGGV